jgi:hypothetical protein
VYLQGVHAQNLAGTEHADPTTHVSVMQAGMEDYVIKVSDWKLVVKAKPCLWPINMP